MVWRLLLPILGVAAILPHDIAADAAGPTTSVQGEYLMTLYVPIGEAPSVLQQSVQSPNVLLQRRQ